MKRHQLKELIKECLEEVREESEKKVEQSQIPVGYDHSFFIKDTKMVRVLNVLDMPVDVEVTKFGDSQVYIKLGRR
jgi:hypothetical protein